MKKIIFVKILLFVSINMAFSQNYSIQLSLNKASFELCDELRDIQDQILTKYYPVPLKITDDFPSTYNLKLQISTANIWDITPNLFTGIFFDLASTAGRIHYADYSGEMENVQKILRWSLGFSFEKTMLNENQLSLITSLQFSFIKTILESKDYLKILNDVEQVEYKRHENSLAIEPGLGLQYNISQNFFFRFLFSYQLDLEVFNVFTIETVQDDTNYYFRPDWSGFRYGFSLGYNIF